MLRKGNLSLSLQAHVCLACHKEKSMTISILVTIFLTKSETQNHRNLWIPEPEKPQRSLVPIFILSGISAAELQTPDHGLLLSVPWLLCVMGKPGPCRPTRCNVLSGSELKSSCLVMFLYWCDTGWSFKIPWNNSNFSPNMYFELFADNCPWTKHQMRNGKIWIAMQVLLLAMWLWIILIL